MLFTFYLRLIGNGTQFIGIVINKEEKSSSGNETCSVVEHYL